MGLFSQGKRSLDDNLTAAGCCLSRIIKKMEPEFRRDSHQKDLRQIAKKEILVGQKENTIFLVSDD